MGLQISRSDKHNAAKLPKATCLQFRPANNDSKITNGRHNNDFKKGNVELCVEEHEVLCCLPKAKPMNKT